MLKAHMFLAIFGASFMLFATWAVPASASTKYSWFIAGKELKKGETAALAPTAALDSSFTLNAPSVSLKISCSTYKTGKTELVGGEEITNIESDKYEGCSEISPSTCSLQTPPVIGPAPSRNEWFLIPGAERNEWRLRLITRSGTRLATITLTGTCALAGEHPLTGSFVLAAPTLGSEEAAQLVEGLGTTENNSLEIAGAKAYIEGDKQLLRLASGSKWSFHA